MASCRNLEEKAIWNWRLELRAPAFTSAIATRAWPNLPVLSPVSGPGSEDTRKQPRPGDILTSRAPRNAGWGAGERRPSGIGLRAPRVRRGAHDCPPGPPLRCGCSCCSANGLRPSELRVRDPCVRPPPGPPPRGECRAGGERGSPQGHPAPGAAGERGRATNAQSSAGR